MGFSPHTDTERAQMLDRIGVAQVSELFADVPEALRYPKLDLPDSMSAQQAERFVQELGARNAGCLPNKSFLGAGTYHHYVPPIVADVLSRPSLYSAYTPYQPELSQGTLQATFEYQSLISTLTGMPVSNAGHYDGATALAEAVLLALGAADNRASRIVTAGNINPQYQGVLRTYLQGTDVEVNDDDSCAFDMRSMQSRIDNNTAAIVIQSPGYLGELVDPAEMVTMSEAIHAVGGLLIVVADPVALGLFQPPGQCGADVVVADGQPLGLPPSFGGPRLGIFAVRQENVRRLVGRLVGRTRDANERRGYVMTLATREQHIRRSRATSNICTNSALGALAATVYLATVGQRGLRSVAELCFHKTHYLADQLRLQLGLTINPQSSDKPWFREFVVELPCSSSQFNARLLKHSGIVGGLDLGTVFVDEPVWRRRVLIAATEVHSRADLDAFVTAAGQVLAQVCAGGPTSGQDGTRCD